MRQRPTADTIRRLFTELANEPKSDFGVREVRNAPLTVPAAPSSEAPILYVTKRHAVTYCYDGNAPCGLLLGYGLPTSEELAEIASLTRGRAVHFLGDLDPPDLLIFAWLAASLPEVTLHHAGVNDWLLERLSIEIPDGFTIQLDAIESRAMPLVLEALPNLEQLVGPGSQTLLSGGRKIEVEAVISALGERRGELIDGALRAGESPDA